MPSPVDFTMLPWCMRVCGRITSFKIVIQRAWVRVSSFDMRIE
jgi:hypothetical protein